jgi:gliding motility-associated-like protein
VKYVLVVLLLLAAVFSARFSHAQSNPCGYRSLPGFQSCFKVYDYDTKQEITSAILCAGRRINIRDCSGYAFDRDKVYYKITSTTGTGSCWPNFSFAPNDTVTTGILIPSGLGSSIRIHQNTPRPNTVDPNIDPTLGALLFSRDFQVRTAPVPTFTLARCGINQEFVRVTIQSPATNVSYFVQVGSTRVAATVPSGTYPVNGATSVTVSGRYNDAGADAALCEGTSSAQIIPTLPARTTPVFGRLAVQGTSLAFSFSGLQPEYRYELRQSGVAAPVTVVPSASNTTTYTLPSASLSACYSLRQTDACETTLTESITLCPVQLTATAAERRNVLTWSTSTANVTGFDIVRNEQPLASVTAGTTTFTDSLVTCGSAYRYQVTARVGSATSVSDVRTVTTVAAQPPRAPQLTASFTVTNAVELTLRVPARDTADRLLVRRSIGGSTQELTVPRRLPLPDQPGTVSLAQAPCYSARFRDPCGNNSPESTVCPPVLEARTTDANGNSVLLRWSAPAGQGSGWTYRLLLVDADGNTRSTLPVTSAADSLRDRNPPAEQQILRYRLEATASNGTRVFSNTASVTRQVRITVPNAFSPNGDGVNDVLLIKGRFLNNFTFTIYNRDGMAVFRTTDRNVGWDGRINGAMAAPQVFPYQVEVTDETGKRVSQRGTITVLR